MIRLDSTPGSLSGEPLNLIQLLIDVEDAGVVEMITDGYNVIFYAKDDLLSPTLIYNLLWYKPLLVHMLRKTCQSHKLAPVGYMI